MANGNTSGSGWGWFWLVVVIAVIGGGYLYQRVAANHCQWRATCNRSTASSPMRVDFWQDVYPIFESAGIRCHGADWALGHFRVDRRDDDFNASGGAALVTPGNSAQSPRITIVRGQRADLAMAAAHQLSDPGLMYYGRGLRRLPNGRRRPVTGKEHRFRPRLALALAEDFGVDDDLDAAIFGAPFGGGVGDAGMVGAVADTEELRAGELVPPHERI